MLLEVHERLIILDLLPKEEDIAGMKAIRRAREAISFTPEEKAFYKLVTKDGRVEWDTARATEQIKDVPIDEYVTRKIQDALAHLNMEHKIREEHMSLYDKFIITYS